MIGPVFGYLLGSLCAKIYVDFEYVDMGEYAVLCFVKCCIFLRGGNTHPHLSVGDINWFMHMIAYKE